MLTVVLGAHFPMGSLNPTRAMDLSYQKRGGGESTLYMVSLK